MPDRAMRRRTLLGSRSPQGELLIRDRTLISRVVQCVGECVGVAERFRGTRGGVRTKGWALALLALIPELCFCARTACATDTFRRADKDDTRAEGHRREVGVWKYLEVWGTAEGEWHGQVRFAACAGSVRCRWR